LSPANFLFRGVPGEKNGGEESSTLMIDMFRTTLQVLHVVARPLLQVLGQKMYMYLGGFKLSSIMIRNDGTN